MDSSAVAISLCCSESLSVPFAVELDCRKKLLSCGRSGWRVTVCGCRGEKERIDGHRGEGWGLLSCSSSCVLHSHWKNGAEKRVFLSKAGGDKIQRVSKKQQYPS